MNDDALRAAISGRIRNQAGGKVKAIDRFMCRGFGYGSHLVSVELDSNHRRRPHHDAISRRREGSRLVRRALAETGAAQFLGSLGHRDLITRCNGFGLRVIVEGMLEGAGSELFIDPSRHPDVSNDKDDQAYARNDARYGEYTANDFLSTRFAAVRRLIGRLGLYLRRLGLAVRGVIV